MGGREENLNCLCLFCGNVREEKMGREGKQIKCGKRRKAQNVVKLGFQKLLKNIVEILF